MTQEEVAGWLGLDLRHYRRYESASQKTVAMSLKTLRHISRVLKINLGGLLQEPDTDEVKEVSR